LPVTPAAPLPEDAYRLTPDIMQRLDLTAIYGQANPVELELGAGDGRAGGGGAAGGQRGALPA
jgi:hypothetical protein